MKNAYAAFQSLHGAWTAARQARTGEEDFEPYGFKDSKAQDFDALFTEWEKALSEAASKTKNVGADDRALETIIIYSIGQLSSYVSPVVSNGFQWLLQSSPFLQKVAELHTALTPILDRRFLVRKAVVESAKHDLNDDIVRVETAAPLAEKLASVQATITEQADKVAEALAEAENAKTKAIADASLIADHLNRVKQLASDATTAKTDYDETVSQASTLLGDAGKTLGAVDEARKKSDAAIVEGERLIKLATEKLDKAIADINRQGLAGSFHATAQSLGRERVYWLIAFLFSIVYLGLVATGIIGGVSVVVTTVPVTPASLTFWERLLHFLPLAAPGIWVGWFTARNASMTARIQQDYAYKVATAQSFEAHKREVVLPGNEKLTAQLLEITIRNFGDNPIRLYDGKGMEGHPLEALKSFVADNAYFEKVLRLLTALKPGSS